MAGAGNGPVAAAAASAPTPAASSSSCAAPAGVLGAPNMNGLLSQLQDCHRQMCYEQSALRHDRSELGGKLTRLEKELVSQEQIGRDLSRRIEALEAALQRERLQHERLLRRRPDGEDQDAASLDADGQDQVPQALPPELPLASELLEDGCLPDSALHSELVQSYLERLPRQRRQSCRELLKDRLQESGIHLEHFLGPSRTASGKDSQSLATGGSTGWADNDLNQRFFDRLFAEEAAASSYSHEGPSSRLRPSEAAADARRDTVLRNGGQGRIEDLLAQQRQANGDAASSGALASPEGRTRGSDDADRDKTANGVPVTGWRKRWTLRSHLDAARCVVCDEQEGVLISCGEDALIKVWDLAPLWRGVPDNQEFEPQLTLRGHRAPVLALASRPQDRMLYSAGVDRDIRAWRLPEGRDYGAYGADLPARQRAMRVGLLCGHTDSVWCLQQHPHLAHLLSASADGTIGIWAESSEASGNAGREAGTQSMEAAFALRQPGQGGAIVDGQDPELRDVPACAAWIPTEAAQILGGYASSRVAVFDVHRQTALLDLLPPGIDTSSCRAGPASLAVTSVACHSVMQFAAVGHVDCCVRLLDLGSGQYTARLGDHGDAVTSVALDPLRGYCLVTGSHDGMIRSFDLRMGKCCQVLKVHQSKHDEAVHCVHHAPRLLTTAGADGHVVVLLPDAE